MTVRKNVQVTGLDYADDMTMVNIYYSAMVG